MLLFSERNLEESWGFAEVDARKEEMTRWGTRRLCYTIQDGREALSANILLGLRANFGRKQTWSIPRMGCVVPSPRTLLVLRIDCVGMSDVGCC
jgi:hypothetical protein